MEEQLSHTQGKKWKKHVKGAMQSQRGDAQSMIETNQCIDAHGHIDIKV